VYSNDRASSPPMPSWESSGSGFPAYEKLTFRSSAGEMSCPRKDGLNWTSYCSNNPVKYVDPSGLDDEPSLWGGFVKGLRYQASASFGEGIDAYNTAKSLSTGAETVGFVLAQFFVAGVICTGAASSHRMQQKGTSGIRNRVPSRGARVIEGDQDFPTLGPPGQKDVFVTAASDIKGLNAQGLSKRLTIPESIRFTVYEFDMPTEGIASPVNRSNPGFIGRGRTQGGAREFVIPNGPIPQNATKKVVE